MNISDGLKNFLSEALVKSKRERFIQFVSGSKGYIKFSKSLSHDLEKYLDKTKFVSKLPQPDLEQTGDLYCSNEVENKNSDTMANLREKAPWEGGWLLVSISGKIAVYRPEGRIDDELYIKL